MAVQVKSYAKVNLTLEIVGQANGYHLLDSLVTSVDVYDQIVLRKRKDSLSTITMHGLGSENIPPEENHALKAAELFSQRFNVNGADIIVYKNIPIGAGMGGSSADVSGVLNGMAKLYQITDDAALGELADGLGSDTRYMLRGGFARMQGRGNILQFLPIEKQLHFLLLTPNAPVSSGACYREYDANPVKQSEESCTEKLIQCLQQNRIKEAGRYLMNDLFLPAARLNNQVKEAQELAQSFSPLGVVMTGSGSGVLALFESKELCEWAKSRVRNCRAQVIKTIIPDCQNKQLLKNPFVLSDGE